MPSTTTIGDLHLHSDAPFPAAPPREILDAAGEILRALAAPLRIALVLQLRESASSARHRNYTTNCVGAARTSD